MSIFFEDLSNIQQDFSVTKLNKKLNGEVHTDFKLINKMLDLIPSKYFENPDLTWLDPCCGRGYFMMALYKRLFSSLSNTFPDSQKRHNHIINNMIHMIELNSDYITLLKNIFGEKSNIHNTDFLTFSKKSYNFIIGNPPYNSHQFKKQSNHTSIWQAFIQKAFSLLKSRGFLLFITPSIWMKNTHPIFSYMLHHAIQKIHTMNSIETSKAFRGEAQLPTSYFLIRKSEQHKLSTTVRIYDKTLHKYILYNTQPLHIHLLTRPTSLPLFAQSIVQKIQKYVRLYGPISPGNVIKSNIRPERITHLDLSTNQSDKNPYPNISTCKLNKTKPYLVINYSNIKCPYIEKEKIVLAHKMYGLPYYDKTGKYGITGRDNFIIINKTSEEFLRLKKFLSSNLFLTLTEAVRYRMSYLEHNLFDMIPDITKIPDFPDIITNTSISTFFRFNKMERNLINSHKKTYLLNNI